MKNTRHIEQIIREKTAFSGLLDMLDASANYRPSLDMRDNDLWLVAEAYDYMQSQRGDARRAYRYGTPTMAQVAQRMKIANVALRNQTQRELGGYIRPREGMLVAMSKGKNDRYRIDEDFMPVSSVSGKKIVQFIEECAVRAHAKGDYNRIEVGMMLSMDRFESFYSMTQGDDYDPIVGEYDVDVPTELVDKIWYAKMNELNEVAA